MSLINEVLRNLSRKPTPQPTPWIDDRPIRAGDSHHRGWLWLALVVVLVLASVVGYHYGESLFRNHVANMVREQISAKMKGGMMSHAAGGTRPTVVPASVQLANPPLNPTANAALPPPPDLQGNPLSALAGKSSSGAAATTPNMGRGKLGSATTKPSKGHDTTASAMPGAATAGAKSMTVPLSALQATPAIDHSPSEFSLTETHEEADRISTQLSTIADLAKAGQVEHANTLFNQLPSTINPQDKIILQAQLLSFQNKNQEAVSLLEDFSQHQSLSADCLGMLAELYDLTGQYDRSQLTYQKLVDFWPDNAKWWLGLGISAMHNGQYSQAIIAFEKVVEYPNQISPEVLSYAQTQLRVLSTHHPTYY